MSYNHEPETAVRRHRAPLIGILVALVVAALAFVWWISTTPEEEGDVSQIESPAAPVGQPGARPGETAAPESPPPGSPAAGNPPPAATPAN